MAIRQSKDERAMLNNYIRAYREEDLMKKELISKQIDLHGRNALVTGAARGIGAATAKVLAREGANIAVADIIPPKDTVNEIKAMGCRAIGIEADISVLSDVKRMVQEAIDAFNHIDILVNNAGVVHRDTLLETSEATWNRVIDIILKGTFLCIQSIYPHMREHGYGKIINVSSISGIIGGAVSKPSDDPEKVKGRSGPAYAAAKGGVIALTRWIAKDVAKDGIYVNSIAPGPCETEMAKGFDYGVQALPIARMGQPEDMAEAILFLASDASNYITGQVLNVDGGWVMA
jgi:3-oxoacyl-[acyl-carrier protein] reductase